MSAEYLTTPLSIIATASWPEATVRRDSLREGLKVKGRSHREAVARHATPLTR